MKPTYLAAFLIAAATSVASAQPNKELYELQAQCGKQAADTFAREYSPVRNIENGQQISTYQNHYSAKFNKCFFLEIGTIIEGKRVSKLTRLFDLNENKQYASYFENNAVPKFIMCDVGGVSCSSEAQWKTLIKLYMED